MGRRNACRAPPLSLALLGAGRPAASVLPNKRVRRPHAWKSGASRVVKMLNSDELERYARHLVLREVGGPGQAALKRSRVLVIGAGGLGAPALLYLAAAGVGTLGVVDDDAVSLSNLQRQIIPATGDLGRPQDESDGRGNGRRKKHAA